MKPQVPYHLSERMFRKFEGVIANAVKYYPGPVILEWEGSGYNANTYAARLRDAISSHRQHNWPSAIIDREKFTEVCSDLVVSQTPEPMRIGSREKLKESVEVEPIKVTSHEIEPILLLNQSEMLLLCRLASMRVLTQPIPVIFETNQKNLEWLEDNFDVTITKTKQNMYLIE